MSERGSIINHNYLATAATIAAIGAGVVGLEAVFAPDPVAADTAALAAGLPNHPHNSAQCNERYARDLHQAPKLNREFGNRRGQRFHFVEGVVVLKDGETVHNECLPDGVDPHLLREPDPPHFAPRLHRAFDFNYFPANEVVRRTYPKRHHKHHKHHRRVTFTG